MNANELEQLSADGWRYELVAGVLQVMSPAGGLHGRVAMRIAIKLGNHVELHKLGVVLAAETGFRLTENPDTVLAADVAFVAGDRYQGILDESKFIPFAPDLAIEVMSPSDSLAKVKNKAEFWLTSGARMVLVLQPETGSIYQFQPGMLDQLFRGLEVVDCSRVVIGWKVTPAEIF